MSLVVLCVIISIAFYFILREIKNPHGEVIYKDDIIEITEKGYVKINREKFLKSEEVQKQFKACKKLEKQIRGENK